MITFLLFFGKPKDKQIKCSRCDKLIPAKHKFCTHCGKEFGKRPGLLPRIVALLFTPFMFFLGLKRKPRKKFCADCKKTFSVTDRFCGDCGDSLSIENAPAPFQFLLAGSLGVGVGYFSAPFFFYVEPGGNGNLVQFVIGFFVGLVFIAICQT